MKNINYCWGYLLLYLNFLGSLAIFLICLSILINDQEKSPYLELYTKKYYRNNFEDNSKNSFDKSDVNYMMWLEFPVIFISFFLLFSFCIEEDECDCIYSCEECFNLLARRKDGKNCHDVNCFLYVVFFICFQLYFGVLYLLRGVYYLLTSCGKKLIRYITITLMLLLNVTVIIFIVIHIFKNYFYTKIIVVLCFSSIITISNFCVLLFVNVCKCCE